MLQPAIFSAHNLVKVTIRKKVVVRDIVNSTSDTSTAVLLVEVVNRPSPRHKPNYDLFIAGLDHRCQIMSSQLKHLLSSLGVVVILRCLPSCRVLVLLVRRVSRSFHCLHGRTASQAIWKVDIDRRFHRLLAGLRLAKSLLMSSGRTKGGIHWRRRDYCVLVAR